MERPNIRTVAGRAGVSTATVSRVLSGFEGVRENTRKKVLSAIKELDYSVDSVARSLRQRKTYTIGLVVGNVLSQFYSTIAKSIEDTVREYGYKTILCNGDDDPVKEMEYLKILRSNKVDGIILTPTGLNRDFIKSTMDTGIQIVLLDRLVDGLDADAVLVDNYEGAYTATKYLLDRGYGRIAIINGFTNRTTGAERLRGYKSALREYGITEDEALIKTGDFKKESGTRLTHELLDMEKPPDAVFVTNMDMTMGALAALRVKMTAIPRGMAVLSFDDPEWSTIIEPPLTAVSQPVYRLGSTAAKKLINRIENRQEIPVNKPSITTLKTRLIIRKSA
jgi:DNA-binding LacI/PurR family transcriptional regulator